MRPLIYFVRHGQTDWNVEFRLQGQADTELNAVGRAQADRNGERLAALVPDPSNFHFVASPLRRTCDTMERLRLAAGLPRFGYATDPRLIEVSFGDWEGSTPDEVEEAAPGSIARREADKWHFVPPGDAAESYDQLMRRFRPWFDEVDRPTVCVTHGGIVRSVFRIVAGMDAHDAAALVIPQDHLLKCEGGDLEWI